MCCSHGYGGYKIFVDDVLMVEGGNFNNYDYRKFGTCPGGDFTSKPTNLITEHPTDRPTFRPTRRPTYRPTSRPTRRPTYVPTSRPTAGSPTHRPTAKQTERPTFRPTLRPTHRPTLRPTSRPTAGSPTGRPTAKKTGLPTHRPTGRPTHRPTLRPTNRPTDEPTTARPTHPLKTGNPTNRPTQMPITPRPTFRPTSTPTIGIPDKTSILIMIAFDNYPEDISWSLVNHPSPQDRQPHQQAHSDAHHPPSDVPSDQHADYRYSGQNKYSDYDCLRQLPRGHQLVARQHLPRVERQDSRGGQGPVHHAQDDRPGLQRRHSQRLVQFQDQRRLRGRTVLQLRHRELHHTG